MQAKKASIVLFFIASMVPTDAEREAAAKVPTLRFRNSDLAEKEGAVETCDAVAGLVPSQYRDTTKFKGKILDIKAVEPKPEGKGKKEETSPPKGEGKGEGKGGAPWEKGASDKPEGDAGKK